MCRVAVAPLLALARCAAGHYHHHRMHHPGQPDNDWRNAMQAKKKKEAPPPAKRPRPGPTVAELQAWKQLRAARIIQVW